MSINLRFAMDSWGVTYQAMVPGHDYHLPPGEGVCELVAVDVRRPSFDSPSRILLGE